MCAFYISKLCSFSFKSHVSDQDMRCFLMELGVQNYVNKVLGSAPKLEGILYLDMETRTRMGVNCPYAAVSELAGAYPGLPYTLSVDDALMTRRVGNPILSREEWMDVIARMAHLTNNLQKIQVFHLDIKADNVLLQFRDGKVVPTLIDFGNAMFQSSERSTPSYSLFDVQCFAQIAPEMAERVNPCSTSDLYSVIQIAEEVAETLPCKHLLNVAEHFQDAEVDERPNHRDIIQHVERIKRGSYAHSPTLN